MSAHLIQACQSKCLVWKLELQHMECAAQARHAYCEMLQASREAATCVALGNAEQARHTKDLDALRQEERNSEDGGRGNLTSQSLHLAYTHRKSAMCVRRPFVCQCSSKLGVNVVRSKCQKSSGISDHGNRNICKQRGAVCNLV